MFGESSFSRHSPLRDKNQVPDSRQYARWSWMQKPVTGRNRRCLQSVLVTSSSIAVAEVTSSFQMWEWHRMVLGYRKGCLSWLQPSWMDRFCRVDWAMVLASIAPKTSSLMLLEIKWAPQKSLEIISNCYSFKDTSTAWSKIACYIIMIKLLKTIHSPLSLVQHYYLTVPIIWIAPIFPSMTLFHFKIELKMPCCCGFCFSFVIPSLSMF